ncbi:MAG: HAMP domain-containing sensor histidine kinase [Desulfuromonadaceae bacterium]|nr:HAMP domain-containing sensor histidine kinase [Desulfuromonadaceae bacterium]MDD5105850.1 HAMP domain-containing sensor histidine kinase [Desulfuromonadaceae bacterium]
MMLSSFFAPAERAEVSELQADQEAIANSSLLKPIIDAMLDFVVILNKYRQIVAINKRMMETFGFTYSDQLMGMRSGDVLNCIHLTEGPGGCGTSKNCSVCGAVLTILASQTTNQQTTGECRVTLQDGNLTSLDLEVIASPLVIDTIPFTICAMRDISSEKRRNVLERVFFHDVLNTAGGLSGVAALLAEGVSPAAEQEYKQWLVSLADNLVDDITHQRRLLAVERGEYVSILELIDVGELLEDIRRLYENHVRTPERTVVVANVDTCAVTTDRALLRRVVGNMTLNALEATPIGGKITISATCTPQNVRIEVTNPGEIPESVQLQLFKRSFSTKGSEGRGIGTYSMKLFGEKYIKGEVGFSSGNGSTCFHITIPLSLDAVEP